MESSKLTDEELIKLANEITEEEEQEVWDLRYYQQNFNIISGTYKITTQHLYNHYTNWSIDPVNFNEFVDIINIDKKSTTDLYIDKSAINLNITRLIGEYVAKQKKEKKEERFRKISSIKSKVKR